MKKRNENIKKRGKTFCGRSEEKLSFYREMVDEDWPEPSLMTESLEEGKTK